ncbi:hypothetical protein LJN55_16555 [Erwinia rhapontici]|uniref:hypothetical protein n=1 Tax=Erwinia rhapontici TaxID=55212 RepID=UPI001D0D998A|nr:hypothetical protein [Erwinia rhapontici]UDQ79064.1 hypothetical protein LJN55_16555 [Erwinia rhapontici]
MRALPEFPLWKTATPPASKKWLAAGSLLTLLAGGSAALLLKGESGSSMIFTLMLLALAITGVLWLCRLVYYRASLHHATTWQQAVAHEHHLWWEVHQSTLALREILLIGPAGSDESDWKHVLGREQRPPEQEQEPGGKALRIARTFSSDVVAREQQLACSLVLLWQKEQSEPVSSFAGVFWLGSEPAWQAFRSQMVASFPEVALPTEPEIWNGEETLSRMAARLKQDKGRQFLLAGCQSCAASSGRRLPAGESAVLWRVAAEGPVVMPRGEVFSALTPDALKDVCQRALKQSDIDDAPDACMLFSHPELPQLAETGWNVTHHLQDSYWGDVGNMQPLIVISLAAIQARHQQQPCGWIATDPQHTLALGIVKPYGKG